MTRFVALGLLSVAASSAAVAREATVVVADEITWGPAPPGLPSGAQVAVLEGDPAKEGPFAIRAALPADYRVPPHTHPSTERVTVLSGTVHLAMEGRRGEMHEMTLPTGSYVSLPVGHVHEVWTEGPVTLQINSMGPFGITYVDPADDPRNRE